MIITTQDYINMVLLIFAYGILSWVLLGISVLIVNRLWIDPIKVKFTQDITAEPKHYRKAA